jgi:Glycosyl transferase family 2
MRVSIIIDNYNYAGYVAQTIESALAQTHADIEVLVVDDGSRDDSLAVIARYADRVTVLAKPNGGQASAYNLGFAHSRGELVMFLDADDWLYPDAIAQAVAAWRPGVSKVQFRLDMVGPQGEPLGRQLPRHLHDGALARRLMREFGAYGSPPGSGNVYARRFLETVLPMDAPAWPVGADSILLLAPAGGEVVSLPEPQGAYRLHQPKSSDALIFNNYQSALGQMAGEYLRIQAGKRLVMAGLERRGMTHAQPLGLAPWEARTFVLCHRFGDPALRERLAADGVSRAGVLRSLWRWPTGGLRAKLLLTGWALAVLALPLPLAMRAGRLHRQSAGQPVAA